MHKFIITFTLLLCLFANANEQEPIKLGAKYNEATAKVEAFKNIQQKSVYLGKYPFVSHTFCTEKI